MEKPYKDLEVTDEYTIREFGYSIDPIHLMWHRDNEDRMVEVLECGKGWGFQFDDGLPFDLEPNTSIFILRHDWHRVVKGEGVLLLKIHKS
jgi:hypothetical protein